nr:unnamed protein product [Callosobruchus chinensis]
MSAHTLFPNSTRYSYVRCSRIANTKHPMTFCHFMGRALLLGHCNY